MKKVLLGISVLAMLVAPVLLTGCSNECDIEEASPPSWYGQPQPGWYGMTPPTWWNVEGDEPVWDGVTPPTWWDVANNRPQWYGQTPPPWWNQIQLATPTSVWMPSNPGMPQTFQRYILWDGIAGADYYHIYMNGYLIQTAQHRPEAPQTQQNTNIASAITNIPSGTEMTFRVRARTNDGNQSELSAPVTIIRA